MNYTLKALLVILMISLLSVMSSYLHAYGTYVELHDEYIAKDIICTEDKANITSGTSGISFGLTSVVIDKINNPQLDSYKDCNESDLGDIGGGKYVSQSLCLSNENKVEKISEFSGDFGNSNHNYPLINLVPAALLSIEDDAADLSVECDGGGNLAQLNNWLSNNGGATATGDCGGVTWTHNFPFVNTEGLIFDESNFSFINSTLTGGSVESLFNGIDEKNSGTFQATRITDGEDWGFSYKLGGKEYIKRVGLERRNDDGAACCPDRAEGGVVQILVNGTVVHQSNVVSAGGNGPIWGNPSANIVGDEIRYIFLDGANTDDGGKILNFTELYVDFETEPFYPSIGSCGLTGDIVVTFTAADDCGNYATTDATFNIEDTTPPRIGGCIYTDPSCIDEQCFTEAYLSQSNLLYSIDLLTGNSSLLGTLPVDVNGIGFNVKDGLIWGFQLSSNRLVRINRDLTIDTYNVPNVTFSNAADINSDGQLTYWDDDRNRITVVDLDPDSPTYLTIVKNCDFSNPLMADMAFNPIDNNLYLIQRTNFSLLRYDINTCTTTNLGTISGTNPNLSYGAFYMDNEGSLYIGKNDNGVIFKIPEVHTGNITASLFSRGPASTTNDGARCQYASVQGTSNLTITCGDNVTLQEWLDNSANAAASDACGNITWTHDFSDSILECREIEVTFIASDDCGNSSSTTAILTIEDTTAPVVTDASDLNVECDGSGNVAELEAWLANNGGATATDDCGGVTWTNNFTELNERCGLTGTVSVRFTATDDCGNTKTTAARFTIEDTTPPGILSCSYTDLDCEASCLSEAYLSQGNAGEIYSIDLITGNSNFLGSLGFRINGIGFNVTDGLLWGLREDNRLVRINRDLSIDNYTVPGVGFANAGDINANGQYAYFSNNTITLVDLNPSSPSYLSIIKTCDFAINHEADIAFSPIDNNLYFKNFNTGELIRYNVNNCTSTNLGLITGFSGGSLTGFGAFFMDNQGNLYISKNSNGAIYKIAAPHTGNTEAAFFSSGPIAGLNDGAKCPFSSVTENSTTIECGDNVALQNWLDNNGNNIVADRCGTVTWAHDFSDSILECGDIEVTFTATDECSNTSQITATLIIEDDTAPTVTEASDLTVECDGGGNLAQLNNWLSNNGGATATDDCGGVTWTHNFPFVNTEGLIFDESNFSFINSTLTGGSVESLFNGIDEKNSGTFQATRITDGEDWGFSYKLGGKEYIKRVGLERRNDDGAACCPDRAEGGVVQILVNGTVVHQSNVVSAGGNGPIWGNPSANIVGDEIRYIFLDGANTDDGGKILNFTELYVDFETEPFYPSIGSCGLTGDIVVTFTAADDCGNYATTDATFNIEDTTPPRIGGCIYTDPSCIDEQCFTEAYLSQSNLLYSIDLLTGNSSLLGTLPVDVNGIGFNVKDGLIWGFQLSSNRLVRINRDLTIDTYNVPNVTFSNAADINSDGQLTYWDDDRNRITVVDLDPDSPTYLTIVKNCDFSNPLMADMAFNPIDNNLYLIQRTNFSLLRYDINTCTTTNLGTISGTNPNLSYGAFYMDNEGSLYIGKNDNGVIFKIPEVHTGNITASLFSRGPASTTNDGARCQYASVQGTSNLTITCGDNVTLQEWLDNSANAAASDACGNITWTHDFSDSILECREIEVTFIASDDCGNSSSTTAILTIEDTTAPVVTDASDITVECDGSGNVAELEAWLANNGGATATDDCGGVTWTNNFTELNERCGLTGTVSVRFTATDDCGNTKTTAARFTIEDTTPPGMSVTESSTTIECGDNVALQNWLDNNGNNIVADRCGTVTWAHDFSDSILECGDIEVTFTATDECSNTSQITATLIIEDDTAPTVTEASDLTVECDGGGNLAQLNNWLSNNGGATATDDCGGVTWTHNFPFVNTEGLIFDESNFSFINSTLTGGSVESLFNGIDEKNSGTFQATRITDGKDWGFSYKLGGKEYIKRVGLERRNDNGAACCPDRAEGGIVQILVNGTVVHQSNVVSAGGGNGPIWGNPSANIVGDEIRYIFLDGANTDDGGKILNFTELYVDFETEPFYPNNGSCGLTGDIVVTFTAADDCGNYATTDATFNIEDTTPPRIGGCIYTDPSCIDEQCFTEAYLSQSNLLYSIDLLTGNSSLLGTLPVDVNGIGFNVKDGLIWGFQLSSNRLVRINRDLTIDTYNVPNVTFSNAADINSDGQLTYWDDDRNRITVVDLDPDSPTYLTIVKNCDFSNPLMADMAFNPIDNNLYLIQRTNFSLLRYDINTCTTTNLGTISGTNPNLSYGAFYMDNEGSLYIGKNDNGVIFKIPEVHTGNITASLFSRGPASTTNDGARCQYASVQGTSNLTITCGDNATLQEWLDNSANAAASDACGNITWTHDFSDSILECREIEVTFIASDDCGNSSSTTAILTIEDTTAPVVTDASDITVECDGSGNVAELEAWLANNGGATATDDCGGVTWTNNFTELNERCGLTGTVSVRFTATDDCGNTKTTAARFTIEDTTQPNVTNNPENLSIECDASNQDDLIAAWLADFGGAEGNDDCGTATWSHNYTGLESGCGGTGTADVVFTLTDECGNFRTRNRTIVIEDTTPPTVIDATDFTVECDGSGNVAELQAWLANNGGATASDICGEVIWTNDYSELSDDCGMTGTVLVIFTATDDCGNTETTAARFTIEDTTQPKITNNPENLSIECDASNQDDLIAAWLADFGGAEGNDDCGTATWSHNYTGLESGCGGTGTADVVFTLTDECGNFRTRNRTIVIEDTTPPTVIDATDLTVECDGSGNVAELEAWLADNGGATASDICGGITWTNDYTELSDDCGMTGTVLVIFTATDDCGNTETTAARFTIEDTTQPKITNNPENLSIECDASNQDDLIAAWLADFGGAEGNDDCGTATWSHNYTGLESGCGGTGTADVVFTLTDECGNFRTRNRTIVIEDTTPPTVIDATDLTVECDGSGNVAELEAWLANNGGATASDICGGITWTTDYTELSDDCGMTGTVLVIFTATDDCGNTETTAARFTIEDTTQPKITNNPENLSIECDASNQDDLIAAWLADFGGAEGNDDCGTAIWSHNYTGLESGCGGTGTADVVFTLTDECGNFRTRNRTIVIEDTTPPTVIDATDLTVECDGSGNVAELEAWLADNGGATASDICGEVIWTNDYSELSDDCGMTGTVLVIFTATDDCGNSSITEAEFIIEDTTAPEITEAGDQTVECDGSGNVAELEAWLADNGGATASDICGEVIWTNDYSELSDDCGMTGTVLVIFTATDDCGNSSITEAEFIIEDTTAPEITEAGDQTVECDGSGNVAELEAWLANNGGATASDICGEVIWTNDYSELSDDCGMTGTVLVIFTATDDCGNSSITEAEFIIEDTTAPEITEAGDQTVECDGSGNVAELEAWLADNGGATASDICGEVIWTNDYSELSDDCGMTGTVSVIFTATDDCGNSSITEAEFIIEDTTAPEITEAGDQTVECDGSGNVVELEVWLADNGGATASDICGEVIWTNDYSELSDDCGMTGTVSVIFTATDDCGNSSITEAEFIIEDTTAPEITEAGDQTVECDGSGNVAELEAWLADNGGATASDICGEVIWTNDYSELSDDCGMTGTVLVIFTATDDCGNSSITEAEFIIEDTTAPEITEAGDQTVECDGSGNVAELEAWLADNGGATASDICGEVIWTNDYSELSDDCGMTGTVSVIFTATDDCGNSSITEAEFIIEDTTAPEITEAGDQTVECDGSGNVAELEVWLADNGGATASDICGGITWTNDYTELSDDCGMTGTVLVIFTATDDCGNSSITEAEFIIEDTTAPEITEAGDQTVECDGSGNVAELEAWLADNGGATASDICGEVIWTNDYSELSDDCGMTGTVLVIFTATDDCGNSSITEAEFIIEDTTAPEITEAGDQTVECDGSGNVAELEAWLADNGGATASDICGEVIWTNDYSELSDDCGMTGTVLVIFTATDDCGNSSITEAEFIIEDTTAPEITEAGDQTVECDGSGNVAELEAWLANNGGATASDICGEVIWTNDYSELSDDCGMTGTVSVIFTATDDCGNSSITEAEFIIEDTTAPEITEAGDQTVECDGSGNVAELEAWLADNGGATASDICGEVIWTNDYSELSDDCGMTGTVSVIFTATDDCGNSSITEAEFIIEDTTAPEITEAGDQTVECDGSGNVAELEAWLADNGGATASDICGEVIWTNDYSELSDDCGMTGTVLVIFTATDDCGNSSITEAEFIIEDTTAPEITEAGDQTVECDGSGNVAELEAWLADNGGATASDICGGITWTNDYTELSDDCGMTGTVLVIFTATDDCGNSSITEAEFIIEDTTAPEITEAGDQTVECDGSGNVAELEAWLADNGGATASDICGGITWTNDYTELSDDCGMTGTVSVIFTATDDCGNSSITEAEFIIEDTTAPEITEAGDQTVECDGSGNVAELEAWLADNGGATASDICGGITWTNDYTELSDDCGMTGTVLVIFTATDDCGNSSITEAEFIIEDTTAPEITEAGDQTVECDGSGNVAELEAWLADNGGATASDICGGITWTNDYTELSDDCGMTGTVLVIFTATDDCGNSSITEAEFNIEDTTAPEITEAGDQTVECDGSGNVAELEAWLADNGGATASDICGGITWTNDYTELSDDCGMTGTVLVIFTATDDCGNSSITEAEFIIEDTTAPEITEAGDQTVECDGSGNVAELEAWLADNGGATASDICGGITWTNDYTELSDDCGMTGTVLVIFTATDDCGNSSITEAEFNIEDTTAPEITEAGDQTVECDGSGNVAELEAWLADNGGATASDICGEVIWTNDYTELSDDCGMTGTASVIFTATDVCGNAATTTARFTIEDTTAPFIAQANDLTVECDENGNQIDLENWLNSLGGAMSDDSCGEITWTSDFTELNIDCGVIGTTLVTFTAADECGNTVQTSSSFTIKPPSLLELNCPEDRTVASCLSQTEIETAYQEWLGQASLSGGCTPMLTNDASSAPDFCAGGATSVTWTVVDDCETITCSSTFTVEPSPGLELNCPEDRTVASCLSQTEIETAYQEWLGQASISGGCTPMLTNDASSAPDFCAGGATSVTWTVVDACETITCSSTFTVEPSPGLELNCPEDRTVASCLSQTEIESAYQEWLGQASMSGGCAPMLTNDASSAPDFCAGGATSVTWTVVDDCETITCSSTFTVEPSPGLELNCPEDRTVASCLSQTEIESAYQEWLGQASMSGGCAPMLTNDASSAPDFCAGGATSVTWTVVDDCETITCSSTFTVEPSPGLELNCPEDRTVASCLSQTEIESAYQEWLGQASMSGGCTPMLTNDASSAPDFCAGGATSVTWTVVDACETITCSSTFTVEPSPGLELNCPEDRTVASCLSQTEIESAYQEWLGQASISGGCAPMLTNDASSAPDFCAGGATSVTWTVVDDCETITCSSTFTVEPSPGLELNCPEDRTVASCLSQTEIETAYQEWLGQASLSGGCTPMLTNDASSAPDFCAGGATSVTWTVVDDCETITCSSTFTVEPSPGLELNCPEDRTVASCLSQTEIESVYQEWLGQASMSGGCAPMLTNDASSAPDFCAGGATSVTWTVVDDCETITCSSTFTVEPSPGLELNCPEDRTVASCLSQTEIESAYQEWLGQASMSGGCAPMLTNDASSAPDFCAGGATSVTWTVVDDCETITCSSTFTVEPSPGLELNCPEDRTVASCLSQTEIESAYQEWLGQASMSGGCTPMLTNDASSAPDFCAGGATSVTWTVVDDCETITCSSTFTVEPSPGLELNCPEDRTVASCLSQTEIESAYQEWLGQASMSGGCTPMLTNDASSAPDFCAGGATSVTWTVVDDCETITCSSTFTVEPSPGLELNCPEDRTVASCLSQTEIESAYQEWLGQASMSGGCTPMLTNDASSAPDFCAGGATSVTWTVVDACETITCSSTFTVEPSPGLELNCPEDRTVASCLSQTEIESAYQEWLGQASMSGGCTPMLTNDASSAPDFCAGGATSVTWTVVDDCETITCSSTFTVEPSPGLELNCPEDRTVASCLSQTEIESAYQEWLGQASMSGGCTPMLTNDASSAPDFCAGGATSVTWTVVDDCETITCSSTFTVEPSPGLELNCPEDRTVASCLSQTEIETAYQEWLGQASMSGGCAPMLTNDASSAPDFCAGGATSVTWTVVDDCETITCSSTFTVEPSISPVITCPTIDAIDYCELNSSISYEAIVSDFCVGNTILIEGNFDHSEISCSGGVFEINYNYSSSCQNVDLVCNIVVNPQEPATAECPTLENVCDISDFISPTAMITTGCGELIDIVGELTYLDGDNGGTATVNYLYENECDLVDLNCSFTVYPSKINEVDTLQICEGSNILWENQEYDQPGMYTVDLIDSNGCSYQRTLELSFYETNIDSSIVDQICEGDTLEIGQEVFTESGLYEVLVTDDNGCINEISVMLTVIEKVTEIISDTICAGDSLTIASSSFYNTGSYSIMIPDSITGCEKEIILELSVIDCSTSSISGTIWEDVNADGIQDSDESGLIGMQVFLINPTDSTIVMQTLSDSSGFYIFEDIDAQDYIVEFKVIGLGYLNHIPTFKNLGVDNTLDSDINFETRSTSTLSVEKGIDLVNINAGFYRGNIIGNQVWQDNQESGNLNAYDSGDLNLADVEIRLIDASTDSLVEVTYSDSEGRYFFQMIQKGNYYVEFVAPVNHIFSTPNDIVGNDTEDSDATLIIDSSDIARSHKIELLAGDVDLTIDAGFIKLEPLSLDGIFLSGVIEDSKSHLEWFVHSKYHKYILLRGVNTVELDTLAIINSNETDREFFIDDDPYLGTSYYRVLGIDYNGEIGFSDFISLVYDNNANNQINIYPNPAVNQVTVELNGTRGMFDVSLYTAIGEKVVEKTLSEGDSKVTFDTSSLINGTYLVHIKIGKHIYFHKLMIVK